MFASKVAKPQTKTAAGSTKNLARQHPTLVARPFGGGAVEQASMLQGTIGNQATLRYLTQRLSNPLEKGLGEHHPSQDARVAGEVPIKVWDFSKIPLFPPERASQPQPLSRSTPPLPSVIQPKLIVGQVDDPLEREADYIADEVMRKPHPDLAVTSTPPQAQPQVLRLRGGGDVADQIGRDV